MKIKTLLLLVSMTLSVAPAFAAEFRQIQIEGQAAKTAFNTLSKAETSAKEDHGVTETYRYGRNLLCKKFEDIHVRSAVYQCWLEISSDGTALDQLSIQPNGNL